MDILCDVAVVLLAHFNAFLQVGRDLVAHAFDKVRFRLVEEGNMILAQALNLEAVAAEQQLSKRAFFGYCPCVGDHQWFQVLNHLTTERAWLGDTQDFPQHLHTLRYTVSKHFLRSKSVQIGVQYNAVASRVLVILLVEHIEPSREQHGHSVIL